MLLLDEKIVGGEDISIEKVPYQVSVQSEGHHRCGGSLIKANVVLSAAHCYQGYDIFSIKQFNCFSIFVLYYIST